MVKLHTQENLDKYYLLVQKLYRFERHQCNLFSDKEHTREELESFYKSKLLVNLLDWLNFIIFISSN